MSAATIARVEDRTLALLMDMSVPVRISFGKTQMLLGDLLDVGPGTVVELDRAADEDVEIVVNGRVIARGEVVEFEGDYGVRIRSVEHDGLASSQPQPAAQEEISE